MLLNISAKGRLTIFLYINLVIQIKKNKEKKEKKNPT